MRWALVLLLALQIPVDSPARPGDERATSKQRREAILTMNAGVEEFARNNHSGAQRKLQEALRRDPGLVHARVNLGRLALERDQLIDAEKQFEVALREIEQQLATLDPGTDAAKQLQALRDEACYDLGRVRLAQAKEPELLEADRRHILEQAVAALDKAPQSDYLAQVRLGLAYDQLDRAGEADRAFRACIAAHPLHGPCYAALGSLYYDFCAPRLAEVVLETGARVDESDAQIWLAQARLLLQLDRPAKAVTKAEKALSLDPDLVQAYFVLGMAHVELREREQAEEALMKFLDKAGGAVPEEVRRHAIDTLRGLLEVR